MSNKIDIYLYELGLIVVRQVNTKLAYLSIMLKLVDKL